MTKWTSRTNPTFSMFGHLGNASQIRVVGFAVRLSNTRSQIPLFRPSGESACRRSFHGAQHPQHGIHKVRNVGMSESEAANSAERPLVHSRIARLWLKELPYIIVLVLTILGVAYTSISHQPLVGYWEFLSSGDGSCLHRHGMASCCKARKLDFGWFGRKRSTGRRFWSR